MHTVAPRTALELARFDNTPAQDVHDIHAGDLAVLVPGHLVQRVSSPNGVAFIDNGPD
jgi:hypothetical protein